MPEVNVPGGGPGTSADMSEYLRRAAMASLDRDFFMDEIKRRFTNELILVVRYGDHQPSATRDLINDVWGDDSPDVGADGSPGPFITFYAVTGHNFPVPPLPEYDPLDVAYLGTVILDAAGVPLPAAQRVCRSLLRLRTLERNSGLPPTPHLFRLSADSIDTAGSLRLHSDFRLVAAALRHVAGGCSQWQFQTQPTGVNAQQGPMP